jgi:YVTN family beta-propeller protein
MPAALRAVFPLILLGSALAAPAAARQQQSAPRVGETDAGVVVPTAQLIRPAGKVLEVHSRPVDAVLSPDGGTLYVKDNRGVVVVDAATWTVRQEIGMKGGTSMTGIAVSRDGKRVYATDASNGLHEFAAGTDGKISESRVIELPGPDGRKGSGAQGKGVQGTGHAYPCGVALSADEDTAYVCLSRINALGLIDLKKGELREEIPVGVAPFAVRLAPDGAAAYVTNWGGRRAKEDERSADSSGTPALVDERGIAASGTVSIVDLKEKREVGEIETGLSASGVELSTDGATLYVANANADTVSVIDVGARRVEHQLNVRPDESLPFGSMPNGLALAPDGKTLYVSCAGNNALAVVRLATDSAASVAGYIPTGWYPGGVVTRGDEVFVASIKGLGSRSERPRDKGRNVFRHLGILQKIEAPGDAELARMTEQARRDARVPQVLAARDRDEVRRDVIPVPVPQHPGEPSVFEHVVYVIKENRTFDQVYGDMGKGNVDPSLCIFGREVTPNQHALAEQFVLLDNFYCNGVCSADGHSWATEGSVTPYLERSFGGFHRSYTFGDDPLTFSSSGFVWDHVLAAGLSFRNYGEFDYAGTEPHSSYAEVYQDFVAGERKIKFAKKIGVERMRRYAAPEYPGWGLNIPDVVRADAFVRELGQYEKSGEWLNFMIVYLPDDHTSGTSPGTPTPRSYVADNDLALGRVVEAITKSRFWARTCIFVIEDDPQDGFDHVDGHRSGCLVISPYTKRGEVVSEFYNQASVLHTMERMMGITAANQLYAAAPLMTSCFTDKGDLRGFTAVPNHVPLAELNKPRSEVPESMRPYAEQSAELALDKPDMINDDTLNRILWHAMKGPDAAYPAEWAGAHGRGLAKLGLKLDGRVSEDDDDDD